MITIQLNQLLFDGYHGLHEEEKLMGNNYEVNCETVFLEKTNKIESVSETINYVSIYEIIKRHMQFPIPLLETLAMEIGHDIHQLFPELHSVEVCIKKMQPPIEGFRGSVGVCWRHQF